jgi:SAM-dependent methyltransferase
MVGDFSPRPRYVMDAVRGRAALLPRTHGCGARDWARDHDPAEALMTQQAHPEWDASYTADAPAPWDIGRPQPTFIRLADESRLTGRLLDAGCGTGENALLAASRGADVTGIDIAPTAIARARAKASERGLTARFEVADVLGLDRLSLSLDTVIDSGVFHVFGDEDRARYVASLAAVLRPAGACYLMCFSDRQPGTWGPRRVRADELRVAFSDGWAVESITADTFQINPMDGTTQVQAWLAAIRRN